jgi:predicted MPP superfamily phosphohydrolase
MKLRTIPLFPPPSAHISRRLFVSSTLALGLGSLVDMAYLEPSWLELTHTRVRLGTQPLATPIRLLHLSDLHSSREVPLAFIQRACELGVSARPDLIVLTGDFITDELQRRSEYQSVLRILSAAAPTFSSLGNHDGGVWAARAYGLRLASNEKVRSLLEDSEIHVLQDQHHYVQVGMQRLCLVGLRDIWSSAVKLETAFPNSLEAGVPRLVLSHNPDSKEIAGAVPWDLMLCGHTHGGQLRVPLTGLTPFAPVKDMRYVAGLNPWNERQIFTTRGVGNLMGMRFNCRPEVSLLQLV